MIAGHLVYVRDHFGGLDPEERPLDMPHVGRPNPRVEASYTLTTEEFALSLAELDRSDIRRRSRRALRRRYDDQNNAFEGSGDSG